MTNRHWYCNICGAANIWDDEDHPKIPKFCPSCNSIQGQVQKIVDEEIKLKLFSANLEPDEEFNHLGFYVMVLALDLEQAKTFVQKEFNDEYEGVIDVFEDDVTFKEIKGPFPAGRILTRHHY